MTKMDENESNILKSGFLIPTVRLERSGGK